MVPDHKIRDMTLTLEALERMDGLVNQQTTQRLQSAIASITMALVLDGFDDNEVEAYIGQITRWTIDDVTDDLA
jgi:AmiR/NasT family two-component response regulator